MSDLKADPTLPVPFPPAPGSPWQKWVQWGLAIALLLSQVFVGGAVLVNGQQAKQVEKKVTVVEEKVDKVKDEVVEVKSTVFGGFKVPDCGCKEPAGK